jgi:hypothetical protein
VSYGARLASVAVWTVPQVSVVPPLEVLQAVGMQEADCRMAAVLAVDYRKGDVVADCHNHLMEALQEADCRSHLMAGRLAVDYRKGDVVADCRNHLMEALQEADCRSQLMAGRLAADYRKGDVVADCHNHLMEALQEADCRNHLMAGAQAAGFRMGDVAADCHSLPSCRRFLSRHLVKIPILAHPRSRNRGSACWACHFLTTMTVVIHRILDANQKSKARGYLHHHRQNLVPHCQSQQDSNQNQSRTPEDCSL